MSAGPGGADPLALVFDALRRVLGADLALTADTDLFTVPGFDSLALAGLVAELEERIGRPVDDDLVTPDVFATPGTVADGLVRPSLGDGAGPPAAVPPPGPPTR